MGKITITKKNDPYNPEYEVGDIFEIAGTASDYQQWLMIAGGLLMLGGVVAYFFKK